MAVADDWPLHDAAAAAALSAAVLASEWGPAVPLGRVDWHAAAAVTDAAGVMAASSASPMHEEEAPIAPPQQPQFVEAAERLEAALFGGRCGGGADPLRLQLPAGRQRERGGGGGSGTGGLRGALAAAAARGMVPGQRRDAGLSGATGDGASSSTTGGTSAAAVAGFIGAVSAALLAEGGAAADDPDASEAIMTHCVWDRLMLLLPPATDPTTTTTAAPAPAPLSPEGEARLVALCDVLVASRDDAPQMLVRSLLRHAVLPHLRALPVRFISIRMLRFMAGACFPTRLDHTTPMNALGRRLPRLGFGARRHRPTTAQAAGPRGPAAPPLRSRHGLGAVRGRDAAGEARGTAAGAFCAFSCADVYVSCLSGCQPHIYRTKRQHTQEHLDALLLGLCQTPSPSSDTGECTWTDLTLPVLTAVLLSTSSSSTSSLGDGTVLALLERVEETVAVRPSFLFETHGGIAGGGEAATGACLGAQESIGFVLCP